MKNLKAVKNKIAFTKSPLNIGNLFCLVDFPKFEIFCLQSLSITIISLKCVALGYIYFDLWFFSACKKNWFLQAASVY